MARRNFARLTTLLCAALVGAAALTTGCATRIAWDETDGPLNRYEGFGGYERSITTSSAEAQEWFNQGIQLLYGYNHDEAIRSFRKAAEVDPDCAMAWWGVAYASGLHINNPEMSRSQSRRAWQAAREARKRLSNASPVEQALIRAVSERYEWPEPADRTRLDEAYADAMEQAWRDFPNDPDVGALFAESLMNLQPWDLWTKNGQPKGRAEEIVEVLERVMAIAPHHPGANHFYIHAVEASLTPERALVAADRLGGLVPGSGHLVHMPSHIYIRTGRYADAVESNERAIAADEAYFATAPEPRFYSLYFMHNVHFLAFAAMMEGRYETAINAARKIEDQIPEVFLREYTGLADGFMPTALHVMTRFGRWEDVLREPAPEDYRLVSRAQRHYARAVALANLDRTSEAREELRLLRELAPRLDDTWWIGNNTAASVIDIAMKMAEGEILYREGQANRAFAALREAIEFEENLAYDEPPGWMHPVRHALGALLLAENRAEEAVAVYRADLKRLPNNGWSLLGLEQALRQLGRDAEADALAPRVAEAWARADVTPIASCYCYPD